MNWPEYQITARIEHTHWWFVGRRQMAAALLEQWTPRQPLAPILDVGCGAGGNLRALARYGPSYGIDISPFALHFARQQTLACLTQASGLRLPYPARSFGVVTLFDVLYHQWIVDDQAALAEVYRVLQPGGWLLLTDSALPLLWSSHDETYYARQRYTVPDMRAKLERTGFQPRVCSYTNFLLLPVFLLVRLMMERLPVNGHINQHKQLPVWLNGLLLRVKQAETCWLRRGKKLPIGGSLICLSQKP